MLSDTLKRLGFNGFIGDQNAYIGHVDGYRAAGFESNENRRSKGEAAGFSQFERPQSDYPLRPLSITAGSSNQGRAATSGDKRMTPSVDTNSRKNTLRALLSEGMTQEEVLDVLHDYSVASLEGVDEKVVRLRAQHLHPRNADNGVAVANNAVFQQNEEGVWVQAWLWVSNLDIGVVRPLPAELQAKLWLVRGGQTTSPPWVIIDGLVVKPLTSFTEAMDEYEAFCSSAEIIKADNLKEAVAVYDSGDATAHWEQDPNDPDLGFYYWVPSS